MFLTLQQSNSISDLQEQFVKTYPFLKIEFFRFPQRKQTLSKYLIIKPIDSSILHDSCCYNRKISIGKTRMVMLVEKELESLFGLYVSIYRKAGDKWAHTSLTSYWTLQEQNEEAEKQSNKMLLLQKRKHTA